MPSTMRALVAVAAAAAAATPFAGATPAPVFPHFPTTPSLIGDPAVTGATYTWVPLPLDTGAACLDGSQYGFFLCRPPGATAWRIGIQGGGWCYNEADCLARAGTPLGSSKTWPPQAANMGCDLTGTTAAVAMNYGDGASFSGFRAGTWPVPGANATLTFRGIRNLDATLDELVANWGLASATSVVLTGGSAGGLSTFLHLDHVAARVSAVAPAARVVGEPVCGFFVDPAGFGQNATYTSEMEYVFNMQNSTGSLSPACQAAYGADAWKCIMAPYAVPFVATPFFALQSRFDHWQLSEEAFVPCMLAQSYSPPYSPSTCTPAEVAEIQSWGPGFMSQFLPAMAKVPASSAFLDACIIHGSTNSSINGMNNAEAFGAWFNGTAKDMFIMTCGGSETAGPCDPSPICAPF
jgi:O-palmitoleoyl-L-serine hydrolase